MMCQELENELWNWVDGGLSAERAGALRAHTEVCPDCRALVRRSCTLIAALADLPAPELSVERERRLLAAIRPRPAARPAAAAAAAAACLALAALLLPSAEPRPERSIASAPLAGASVAEVELRLHEPRVVSLALEAQHTIEDVTVVLELPPGVRIQNRPDQRTLRWQTVLLEGANRLSLPLVAEEPGSREMVARIEHRGRIREVRLHLHAIASEAVAPGQGAASVIPGRIPA